MRKMRTITRFRKYFSQETKDVNPKGTIAELRALVLAAKQTVIFQANRRLIFIRARRRAGEIQDPIEGLSPGS